MLILNRHGLLLNILLFFLLGISKPQKFTCTHFHVVLFMFKDIILRFHLCIKMTNEDFIIICCLFQCSVNFYLSKCQKSCFL